MKIRKALKNTVTLPLAIELDLVETPLVKLRVVMN